jgi:uncharacterized protein with HEPN domain
MTRDRQYLNDILTSANLAISYISSKSKEEFVADIQCQDAVNRRIEIIGEAANRVSETTRSTLAMLPWHQMIGMRNVVIHQYDAVDLDIVWDTVQDALPLLISELERFLSSEQ